MCMFVCALSGVYCYFVPDSCILKCVYCEEVNVKMCKIPIHSSTPRGRCQVWLVPRVEAHLSSWASAMRPASIFGMQRIAKVLPRLPVCSRCFPCIVLRVAYSACLDVAIFGFANQVFWRLFCHVRLCCCLLVECDLFTCCRELA